MLPFLLLSFIEFPSKPNAILSTAYNKNPSSVLMSVSGSMGLHYGGKCHITTPNLTLTVDRKTEWCSNIGSKENKPWISYSINNKMMKLTSYAIRNGCCWYECCCIDDEHDLGYCCCELYSFSLQGSNDNITWKTIHKVEKESNLFYCTFKTYDIPGSSEAFKYIRIIQDEEKSYCPFCMQINQIEFYGTLVDSFGEYLSNEDDDESVSIIGKIRNGNQE